MTLQQINRRFSWVM